MNEWLIPSKLLVDKVRTRTQEVLAELRGWSFLKALGNKRVCLMPEETAVLLEAYNLLRKETNHEPETI